MSAPAISVLSQTRQRAGTWRARSFWMLHAWLPAAACAAMLALFSLTSLDTAIAQRVFHDSGPGLWIGAHTWWADDVLHTGGRDLMRAVTTASILLWVLGRFVRPLSDWSPVAGYFALCVILTVGTVGLLKSVTNVDCPWDLQGFGGTRPYVHVIGDRPDGLPHARCFPGAHSSSAFAVVCLYFALRDRRPRLARVALLSGLAFGALFSVAQQARGAHFLSHDLTSAFVAWFVGLAIYISVRRRACHP